MRLGPAVIAVLPLALALILPGCGDEQTKAAGTRESAAHAAKATTTDASTTTGRPASIDLVAPKRCRSSLGDWLDSMESLNNSLAVGLSYDDYLTAVNHVRSTYAPIDADRLTLLCLAHVASPAERALNTFIGAANAWGDCLASSPCDSASIEPELQRDWGRAADLIASAQRDLRRGD